MNEFKKHIDEMTKSELKTELEEIRDDFEVLRIKSEIAKIVDRLVTSEDLQKVLLFAEEVYKSSVPAEWGFLYGLRDNIHDMADTMVEKNNFAELKYFNYFMFHKLLEKDQETVKNLYTVTDAMKKALFERKVV